MPSSLTSSFWEVPQISEAGGVGVLPVTWEDSQADGATRHWCPAPHVSVSLPTAHEQHSSVSPAVPAPLPLHKQWMLTLMLAVLPGSSLQWLQGEDFLVVKDEHQSVL